MNRNSLKKYLSVLLILSMIFAFATGCGVKDNAVAGAQDNNIKKAKIDVDMTMLSSTVVYSELYSINSSPEEYEGKVIKMSGSYYEVFFEENGEYYSYVVANDVAACCQQGLEFRWKGEHNRKEYPKADAIIEVVGVLKTYEEFGYKYCYIEVDNISVL